MNRVYLQTRAQPWELGAPPQRLLAIRLQAIGDVVITLPYLQALRDSLPGVEIDLLTREEAAGVPDGVALFRQVYRLGGGRSTKRQLLHALRWLPALRGRRYDAVLDLQNNRVSRLVRQGLRPAAWSEFDRYAPVSAGERTRRTIDAAGFPLARVEARLTLKEPEAGTPLLRQAGWDADRDLIILSPAAFCPSRNWPLENYAAFARLWQQRHDAQFAILGLPAMQPQAEALAESLGGCLLDLVGKTTAAQALAIVQRARLVLTEDCGLMHFAWVSGIPTLALFGSSPHVWSAPQGSHSRCLHSGDLPCGACMQLECRFGDTRCLTRYTPEFVVAQAEELLRQTEGTERLIYAEERRGSL